MADLHDSNVTREPLDGFGIPRLDAPVLAVYDTGYWVSLVYYALC